MVFGVVVAAATAIGSFRQFSNAPVQITNVVPMSDGPEAGPFRRTPTWYECVSFRNAASKPIAHVQFVFWRETPDGEFVDETAEPLDVKAPIAPGATSSSCRTTLNRGNLIAQVRTVEFADGSRWNSPGYSNDPTHIPEPFEPAPQGVGVTLSDAYLDSGACVDYSVDGAHPYTNLFFVFEWTDLAGQLLNDDVLTYPQGTKCAGMAPYGAGFTLFAHVGLSGIRYADGSLWSVVPPIPGAVRNVPASGVALSSVATYVGVTPQKVATNAPWGLDTCATVTNISQFPITHFQIVFAHVDANNRTIGEDALDVRQALPPGASATAICRTLQAGAFPSLISYIRAAAAGSPIADAPGIYYKNAAVTLSARITRVDFAGGKSWQMQ